jgi:hypothetical protein
MQQSTVEGSRGFHRRIAFSLAFPFLLVLIPWLLMVLSGRGCGPSQPTWQCRLLEFSLGLLYFPFYWTIRILLYMNLDLTSTTVGAAEYITGVVCAYSLWALAAYVGLWTFGSIRKRIPN